MGKKSRNKRHKKKWIKKTPDEVIVRGTLQIERYGRYIRFTNTSTPEQHRVFLEHAKKSNKQILIDLERELAVLQSFVPKYDPVELMYRAAYMLLPLFMKYRSENEFQSDESYFLPTVEYLQYLIARTEPNTDGKVPSEEEWDEIWTQALKVMHLTQSHLMTRERLTDPPTEIDSLRFLLDGQRLMVRVKRYPLFLAEYLRSALSPYEQQIKDIYDVSIDEIIEGFTQIDDYQKTGVLDRYNDVCELTDVFTDKLREKGYAVDPDATPEEIIRTQAAFELEEFRTMHEELQEKMRLTFTPVIFEITNLTSLPKPFLSLLSVRPGESILKTITGPDHDDLSPLSTSVLHYKPFLEMGGKFYTFYHSGFEDHMADIIEKDLFEKRSAQVTVMAKKRSDRLESDSMDLLSSIIKPDFVFQNVYYSNPDDNGTLTELDILLGVDDILFLVEAKAGGFSGPASRGAPKSMAQKFFDLIIEGQRQSERAEKYIKSGDEVAFFDATGRREVHRIRNSHFRNVIRIVITREDLGWVGAQIAILSMIYPGLSTSYPWHVYIDDLRIIAELFKGDEIRFMHYLQIRLQASKETTLRQRDEIEHIGLYNKINVYHELPIEGLDSMTFDASYMRDIDHYFMDRYAGEVPLVPTQDMPSKMRSFISALASSRLSHRFEVGSAVLSMDTDGRENFKDGLEALDTGRVQGRQRTFRMPFTSNKYGLSISYANGQNWLEELRKSAVQMEQSNCDRWLVVQLEDKPSYEVSKIEVITPGRFTDSELNSARSWNESKIQKRIAEIKPGRNDLCPCGSGKKFKKCHLN